MSTRSHYQPLKRSLVIATLLFAVAGCSKQATPEQTLINTELDSVILPLHQNFEQQTAKLNQQAILFCDARSPEALETLREQWLVTMQSWQRVQSIDFGPIKEDNQAWMIQFWPDKKNLIKQKAQQLLAGDDIINSARIERASVVIQGLSASEYLLFDRQSLPTNGADFLSLYDDQTPLGQRRCNMLVAVSAHSHGVAQHINERWQGNSNNPGYAEVYRQFGKDNLQYHNADEAVGTLIQSMVSVLEKLKKDKIGGPLGYNAKTKTPRPYLVEAWRSQESLQMIDANLDAIEQLFNGGLLDYIASRENGAELADKLGEQLDNTQFATSVIKQSLFKAVNNGEEKAQVEELYRQVSQLLRLLKNDTVTTLGITLGFNSNDGD